MTKRAGQQPKEKSTVLYKCIGISVTEPEKARIDRLAADKGMTVSAFLRPYLSELLKEVPE